MFSKQDFYRILPSVTHYAIVLGSLIFFCEIVTSFLRCIFDPPRRYSLSFRLRAFFGWFFSSLIAILLFTISLIPLASINNHGYLSDNLWPPVIDLHNKLDNYQLVHSYGLFRSMTGVGGRPEVIVQGSTNGTDGPWTEYAFLYKVGDVNRKPPVVTPHQPRLDWQMWFAALGSFEHNPWFISMVWKLLKNEPKVLKLIDNNPFAPKAPAFIKADLYHYHYTDPNTTDGNWWIRQKKHVYMPPVSLTNNVFENYLIENGLLLKSASRPPQNFTFTAAFLRLIRQSSETTSHPVFIWLLTFVVSLTLLIKLFIF